MTDSAAQTSASSTPQAGRPLCAVILAAGKGTRMNSDLAKVLHRVCERPMVAWVIDACREAGCERIYVVIGHQGEKVQEALADQSDLEFVWQREQKGTGHAVLQAEAALRGFAGDVLVLAGDGPLIRGSMLTALTEVHRRMNAAATLATAEIDDPTGYGRIVRDSAGRFERIVEHKDATEAQRGIREVNPSYYCFRAEALFPALHQVGTDNAKGEVYLTDVLEILRTAGQRVHVEPLAAAADVLSINTPEQLAEVEEALSRRLADGAAR